MRSPEIVKSAIVKRYMEFVALGDSIISDDYPGPGLGAASLLHRNDDERFPQFAGRDLRSAEPALRFRNLSKTGWMLPDLQASLSHLKPSREPSLAVICGGGNDLLAAFAEGADLGATLTQIRVRYSALLEELGGLYADLDLRILNAYDPTDGTGTFQSGRYLPEGPAALAALNQLLAQIAGERLVDIHSLCLGHGMRHRDPDYEHFHTHDPSGWFKFDIEPNNLGAHHIRALIWESL